MSTPNYKAREIQKFLLFFITSRICYNLLFLIYGQKKMENMYFSKETSKAHKA